MRRSFKWFGAVAIAVGLVVALYGVRMVRRGFSTRGQPSAMEASMAMSMRDMAIPVRYKTLKSPVATDASVIHDGMAHWADHCATCHANNGSGDTMYGRGMYPRPPDMRLADTQGMSDGELYYTIKNGVRLTGMPAFGEAGDSDVDSWKLVAFIRHLPKLTDQEESEMERLNPKGPDEMQEQTDEDKFLNGGTVTPSPKMPPMNH